MASAIPYGTADSFNELAGRTVRKCYLITYSQVHEQEFPTRGSFAKAVLSFSFKRSQAESGFHHHRAIKFDVQSAMSIIYSYYLLACAHPQVV